MNHRNVLGFSLLWTGTMLVAGAHHAEAQSTTGAPPQANPAPAAKNPEEVMMGLDRILDQIAHNLTTRYNLNDRQSEFTHDLLHTRVKKFLEDHYKEAWPALRELMHYQMNAETPPTDAAKRLAEAAIPLFEEAKKAIRDGNDAWRKQLSEDQIRMHDYDLKEMEKQFKEVEGNLGHWKEGQPSSGSLFPAPPKQKDPNQPATPPKPPADKVGPAVVGPAAKDRFTAFVDEFTNTCQLDAGQTTTAKDILRDILARVESYNQQHKTEFAKLAEDDRKAMIEGDVKKQDEIDQAQKKLNEPIQAMFDEMVTRLVGTLRAPQKEIYNRTMAPNPSAGAAKNPAPQAGKPDPKSDPAKQEPPKPEAVKAPSGEAPKGASPPPTTGNDGKTDGKSGKKKKKD